MGGPAGISYRTLPDVVQPDQTTQDKLHSFMRGGKFEPEYLVETEDGKPPKLPDPSALKTEQNYIDFIHKFGSVEAQKVLAKIQKAGGSVMDTSAAIKDLANDIRAGVTLLKLEGGTPPEKLTPIEKNAYINAVLTRMPVDNTALSKALADNPDDPMAAIQAYLTNLELSGEITPKEHKELLGMLKEAVKQNGGDVEGVANQLLRPLKRAAIPEDPATAGTPVISGTTATSDFGNYSVTLTTDEKGKKQAIIKNNKTGEETTIDPTALKNGTFDLQDPAGSIVFNSLPSGVLTVSITPSEGDKTYMLKWGLTGGFTQQTEEQRTALADFLPPNATLLYEQAGRQDSGALFTPDKAKAATT